MADTLPVAMTVAPAGAVPRSTDSVARLVARREAATDERARRDAVVDADRNRVRATGARDTLCVVAHRVARRNESCHCEGGQRERQTPRAHVTDDGGSYDGQDASSERTREPGEQAGEVRPEREHDDWHGPTSLGACLR